MDPPEAAAPQRGVAEHARPVSGGAGPVRQGQRGVAAERATRQSAGAEVEAEEMTVETPLGRRRMDLVVRGPDGQRRAVEVKTGGSRYTPLQRAKDEIIATEGGTAVGPRAQAAGLAGPIRVQTEVVRRPR